MNQELLELITRRKEVLKQKEHTRRIMVIRRKYANKKPTFLRWLWWKFSKFENRLKWKRPRGKDNPGRLRLKGYPPMASAGYGTRNDLRSLHPSGLKPAVIHNVKELELLNPSKHILYISSSLGLKKKLELIEKARAKGFRIANS